MDPDDYTVTKSKNATNKSGTTMAMKWLPAVVIAIVVLIGGFVAGVQYQKGKTTTAATTTASASGMRGFNGQMGMRRSGGLGTVTAISATSITITPRSFGPDSSSSTTTSKSYTIASSTAITDSGSTVDYTDIKVGDTVLVRTSSTTSSDATTIEVNPTTGGGFGGQDAAPSSQTDSSADSSSATSSI